VAARKHITRQHADKIVILRQTTAVVAAMEPVAHVPLRRNIWTLSPNLILTKLHPLQLQAKTSVDLVLSLPNLREASLSSPMAITNQYTSTTIWLINAGCHMWYQGHTPLEYILCPSQV
jgi:hypothetical protein